MSEQHPLKSRRTGNVGLRPKLSPAVAKKFGKNISISSKNKLALVFSGRGSHRGKGPGKRIDKEKQHLQKQKFLGGGNIVDPLNLNSLIGKEGSDSPKNESPIVDRGQEFEPDDVRPVDESDPLKLNCLEDENLMIKAPTQKKHRNKKKRQKHHRRSSESHKEPDSSHTTSQESQDSGPEEDSNLSPKAKVQKLSTDTETIKDNFQESKQPDVRKDAVSEKQNNSRNKDDIDVSMESSPNKSVDGKKKHHKFAKKHKQTHHKGIQKNIEHQTVSKDEDKATKKLPHFRAKDEKFRYGNYNRYYGYRNPNAEDDRIQHLQQEWFNGKDCLDIGCNVGHLTLWTARHLNPKTILGVDIDNQLIKAARNNIRHYIPTSAPQAPCQSEFPISFAICQGPLAAPVLPDTERKSFGFPYNVTFRAENYIPNELSDLDNIKPAYDLILCLSVTKWVQLNWGDDGVKRMFKKIYLSLRPGGRLLLEPQPWKSYKKKKNLTPLIRANYEDIKFLPDQYIPYLLSSEIGFATSEVMGVPQHKAQGFQRPLYLLTKGTSSSPKSTDIVQEPVMSDVKQKPVT